VVGMSCFREALRVRELLLGTDSEKVADTLHILGRLHGKLMKLDEAMACYEKSLEVKEALGKSSFVDVLYEMITLACKHRAKFSLLLNKFDKDLSELFPLGVFEFKVHNSRIEGELMHPCNKNVEKLLLKKLSNREFLSPGTVSMDTLPASVILTLQTISKDQFSEDLWRGLWMSLRSEWLASNASFWKNFCCSTEASIRERGE